MDLGMDPVVQWLPRASTCLQPGPHTSDPDLDLDPGSLRSAACSPGSNPPRVGRVRAGEMCVCGGGGAVNTGRSGRVGWGVGLLGIFVALIGALDCIERGRVVVLVGRGGRPPPGPGFVGPAHTSALRVCQAGPDVTKA